MSDFEDYPCVGVCMDDPDTGYCLGCGRPPHSTGRTPPPPPPPTDLDRPDALRWPPPTPVPHKA